MSSAQQDVDVDDRQVADPQPPRGRRGAGRSTLVAGAVGLVVGAVVVALVVVGLDREPAVDPARSQVPDTSAPPASSWLSGASGNDVANGEFGAWRGSEVEIAAAFADDNERMVELENLQPGAEFGDWQADLDVAVGAFGEGESWAEAADGAYDDRWRESLEGLARAWEGRPGTLYIRFAHEMNGTWYDWSVDSGSADDFVAGWERYRALQQEVFPEAQLVFCTAKRSSDSDFDWREAWPGGDAVDVLSVDYYNQSPYVETAEAWEETLPEVGELGDPIGLEAYLDFAEQEGVPLAVSEWNGNADEGDSTAYIDGMHAFFAEHGGTGPGQLLYESVFNRSKDDNRWLLYGDEVRMPATAERYKELF